MENLDILKVRSVLKVILKAFVLSVCLVCFIILTIPAFIDEPYNFDNVSSLENFRERGKIYFRCVRMGGGSGVHACALKLL